MKFIALFHICIGVVIFGDASHIELSSRRTHIIPGGLNEGEIKNVMYSSTYKTLFGCGDVSGNPYIFRLSENGILIDGYSLKDVRGIRGSPYIISEETDTGDLIVGAGTTLQGEILLVRYRPSNRSVIWTTIRWVGLIRATQIVTIDRITAVVGVAQRDRFLVVFYETSSGNLERIVSPALSNPYTSYGTCFAVAAGDWSNQGQNMYVGGIRDDTSDGVVSKLNLWGKTLWSKTVSEIYGNHTQADMYDLRIVFSLFYSPAHEMVFVGVGSLTSGTSIHALSKDGVTLWSYVMRYGSETSVNILYHEPTETVIGLLGGSYRSIVFLRAQDGKILESTREENTFFDPLSFGAPTWRQNHADFVGMSSKSMLLVIGVAVDEDGVAVDEEVESAPTTSTAYPAVTTSNTSLAPLSFKSSTVYWTRHSSLMPSIPSSASVRPENLSESDTGSEMSPSTFAYRVSTLVQSSSVVSTVYISETPMIGGGEAGNFQSNLPFSLGMIVALLLASFAGSICCTMLVAEIIRYRRRLGEKSSSYGRDTSYSSSTSELRFESHGRSFNPQATRTIGETSRYANRTTGETSRTLVPLESGLSVPAYLRLNFAEDLRLGSQLAKGAGGQVFNAEMLSPTIGYVIGKNVVVKMVAITKEKHIDAFFQEIAILCYLQRFPNICKLAGYCDEPYAIILKLYPQGNLFAFLENKTFHHSTLGHMVFAHDIAAGLSAIHLAGIAHCDMKPQNILLDFDEEKGRIVCVIADFGVCQVFDPAILKVKAFNISLIRGWTKPFAAPEILLARGKPFVDYHRGACDLYSYGMIMYHLFIRVYPWS